MSKIPEQLENQTLKLKANIYFDGGVISHTIVSSDKKRRTIGLIKPGSYHFNTDAAERMDLIAGTCKVKQAGESGWKNYGEGEGFNVPAQSSFDISVETGFTEYLCSFE